MNRNRWVNIRRLFQRFYHTHGGVTKMLSHVGLEFEV